MEPGNWRRGELRGGGRAHAFLDKTSGVPLPTTGGSGISLYVPGIFFYLGFVYAEGFLFLDERGTGK